MNWLDIVIIILLTLSFISGFKEGFILKVGNLIGLFFGIWLSSVFTPTVADWFGGGVLVTIAVFLILLGCISGLFELIAWIVDKIFKILTIIPGLKQVNKILGAFVALLATAIFISAVLFVADAHKRETWFNDTMMESALSGGIMKLSVFYVPLLSDSFDEYITRDEADEEEWMDNKGEKREEQANDEEVSNEGEE